MNDSETMAEEGGVSSKIGVLVVGLAGNNGVTLLAGLLANRQALEWEGSHCRLQANWNGCITQLPSKGGKGGYRERHALADVEKAAVGGWDIRSTPLGDGLYEYRILDYDLVRQVREEMNQCTVMKGIWDADFIGESQYESATHVADCATQADKLAHLRADIRRFVADNGVTGHTTVIWSASVERPMERLFTTPEELMAAITANDKEVSPSVLYATAAVLEGCSFVNGGSQNTMCPALELLADAKGCYMLGTDFKAGQTKFKTAAVEYIRALGLQPRNIASSNHLGNNDMLNLTTKKTLDAKMRVKKDIFQSWEEDIDHQVRVMYMPLIGDDKRDIVEYTSLGFMGSPHTMLTYTRCMDSVLCVPLMIDCAVWTDYFSRCLTPQPVVSRALAYLFKVPEGGAKGTDPGFFHQMQELEKALAATTPSPSHHSATKKSCVTGRVVCAGVSCLDMELVGSTGGAGKAVDESINTFSAIEYLAGGSCPQTASSLGFLGVPGVLAVTKVGQDSNAEELVGQMEAAGVDCTHVIRSASDQTSLAVLPIFSDGGRGCYANLAANTTLEAQQVVDKLAELVSADPAPISALHYGYPHLTPGLQGAALKGFLERAKDMLAGAVISVDVNGVETGEDSKKQDHESIIGQAYPCIGILHANLDEAKSMSGVESSDAATLAQWFIQRGVGLVAITMGTKGAHVQVAENCHASKNLPAEWAGKKATLPAFALSPGSSANSNGAGDAFAGGMVLASIWRDGKVSLEQAVQFAQLASLQRVDSAKRNAQHRASATELMAMVRGEGGQTAPPIYVHP